MVLPYNIRLALYVLTVIGTPLITVLATQGLLGELWVQLWGAFVTGVGALAAVNVTK